MTNTTTGGGVDLKTLVITAVASASAAYITSEIWAPGTLASAAITPVIVALVKEGLAKPAAVVTRAVPVRGVVRSTRHPDEPYDPARPVEPANERVPQAGEVAGVARSYRRPSWKAAVITGLLGFVIAAVIITLPEVVAGESASGGDRTTLFGGDDRSSERDDDSSTTTSPTQTETTPPAGTVTVPPVETTTVPPETTTVPPAQTPPAQTTPVPPPATTPQPPAP